MVAKNLPWAADWLARAGYAGHLVRDLSNTHLMIVGGGTLIATGVCWYALPRIVGRPLASNGLAQCAFWFTAVGLLVFYVAFVGNGIAMGRLVAHGWDYEAAKAHMGNWYRVPVGMGAGIMGLGYWCFAANVFLTVFQARLVRVPKPRRPPVEVLRHRGRGPDGRHRAGRHPGAAGERRLALQGGARRRVDRPHQPRAHQPRHRADDARGRRALPSLPRSAATRPRGALATPASGRCSPARSPSTASALYLGFHEGGLVVGRGSDAGAGRGGDAAAPVPDHGGRRRDARGVLAPARGVVRAFLRRAAPLRPFVLAGCAALAVGTLQGPVQAFPAVNELLDRGGDAGDVIVNLHAQLNMLGGLMVVLVGLALCLLRAAALARRALVRCAGGMAVYYAGGIAFAAVAAHEVAGGRTSAPRCAPRALARPRARARCARRPRLRRVRLGRLAHDGGLSRGRSAAGAGGARRLHRAHPEPGAPAQAGGCRRLRAAHGPARLPRRRLAVRRLPVDRDDPADRSGARLGGIPVAFSPFATALCTPSAGKVESFWLPASTLVSTVLLLSRTSPEALAFARLTATTRKVAAELPDTSRRVGRCNRPAPRGPPVCACCRRDRRRFRPLRLPDRIHA